MLLTIGLKGTPSLCIFGSPYSLGGLEPAGRSFLRVSSVSVDFLSSCVVFLSVESVGSLDSLRYATLPSSLIPSCDLFICVPLNPVVPKFIYDTLSGILFSSILCTCPNQRNRFNLMFSNNCRSKII